MGAPPRARPPGAGRKRALGAAAVRSRQRGRPAPGALVRVGIRLRGGGAGGGAGAAAGRPRTPARPPRGRPHQPPPPAPAPPPPRPGRGLEAVSYRFEIVSDYGAFRDLQRHRLLTVQWQALGPELGAGVPHELDEADVGDLYRAGLERSREEYARIADAGRPELAHYALALGYRIRYVLDMNAREAMHLIELRSGR